MATLMAYGRQGYDYMPIDFDDDTLLIDTKGEIFDDEIFKAVCNGFVIDLSQRKDDDDIIDI